MSGTLTYAEDHNTHEEIWIQKSNRKMNINFRIFIIQDGDYIVIYAPSLKLTAYGNTEKEAMKMFKAAIDDYTDEILKLSLDQINAELRKHGWSQLKFFKKQFINNSFVDKNGVLKNFNLPKNTPVEEGMLEVG